MAEEKNTIFSGIQPSRDLTLGNYLGAVKNWASLQEEYKCYYCVVDLHAITVRQQASVLRSRCLDVMSLLIAAGLDPERNILFMQSHVSAHAELAWILNCFTYTGELDRMIQYKEKIKKNADNQNAGLYTYPVLMAADILLYGTHMVPVGADQKQHLEITRDIAIRFNNLYGDVFTVPEPYIPKTGARIMSLAEPEKKMSKSDENENAYIALLDAPDVIVRKVKRAVTDSEGTIQFSEDKPGVSNLMSIYSSLTDKSIADIEKEFEGLGYGALKEAVATAVVDVLVPIQKRYKEIRADKEFLNKVMEENAAAAGMQAGRMLAKVYKKVGLAPRKI
ncbi:MAG: tryptophan--tRNA ligase [Eubacteriales bacterium]